MISDYLSPISKNLLFNTDALKEYLINGMKFDQCINNIIKFINFNILR
jgi:hypothetical protein